MANSLQDQLLRAGLVDSKQIKKANTEKRKKAKQQRGKKTESTADSAAMQINRKRLEKSQRDRQLNRERSANAKRKELNAQIRQLLEKNRQPQDDNGVAYNFEHDNKLRRVYVSDPVRKKIINGQLAIVKHNKRYEIVPADVARKIVERHPDIWTKFNDAIPCKTDENDPYSNYSVPDDLVW